MSLAATTLLHEAYLEMAARDGASFPDRARFMTYAARVMREVTEASLARWPVGEPFALLFPGQGVDPVDLGKRRPSVALEKTDALKPKPAAQKVQVDARDGDWPLRDGVDLSDGDGAQPYAEPRPVVKQIMLAPPATWPVADTGS